MKLSFCLPTLNRGKFIGATLESIVCQMGDDAELVIVDGGSTDNTAGIVREYQANYPRIRYWRQPSPRGIDTDVLASVQLAQGLFCWFMSDDDLLAPTAVYHVMERLDAFEDLAGASLNYGAFDPTMSFRVATVPATSGSHLTEDHLFTNAAECFSTLGMHLGYLPAQIVKRQLWNETVSSVDLAPHLQSCWLLTYVIGKMLQRHPKWLYIHQECIQNRTINDSFVARVGEHKRQLITHVAFPKVVSDLFGAGSATHQNILRASIRYRMPRNLAKIKAMGAPLRLQFILFFLYARIYGRFSRYWLTVMPLFFLPNFMMSTIRMLYFRWVSRHANAFASPKKLN